jgi:hypothetical protein
MSRICDPPPWVFELCLGCGGAIPLATHELTCPCFDLRTRVAVAWICDNCDLFVGLVGLFTSWPDAISARQRELDHRAARYFSDVSRNQSQPITPDCRPNVTTESRRHGPKERRR